MDKPTTYSKFLTDLTSNLHLLKDKPDETPASTLNAMWLTASGQPCSAIDIKPDQLPELSASAQKTLSSYIKRRGAGEPLAHITKRQRFLDLEFISGAGALIPRKETEILARAALDEIDRLSATHPAPLIIDVCTGMANLAIVMARHSVRSTVVASDLSNEAVKLARDNVLFHQLENRVEVFQGDLLEPFSLARFQKKVNLISCNPPYISSSKVQDMDNEISSYEPKLAFDGGPFGINILQRLLRNAPEYLAEQGCLIFEVGLGQGEMIIRLVNKMKPYKSAAPVYDSKKNIRAVRAYV